MRGDGVHPVEADQDLAEFLVSDFILFLLIGLFSVLSLLSVFSVVKYFDTLGWI